MVGRALAPLLASLAVLLLVLGPASGEGLVRFGSATGFLAQDEVHGTGDYLLEPPQVCLMAVTPLTVTLRAVAWTPGDELTLRVLAYSSTQGFHVLSAATQGSPPTASISYTSQDSCARFEVEGTSVALRAAYVVDVS